MLLPAHTRDKVEAGCDEAGRGCLAGPVYAAAVVLPREFSHPLLQDSKQLSAGQREEARQIVEQEALSWAVASVGPREIDQINILNASFLAMHRAIEQLATPVELLLIDGNRFKPYRDIPFACIVKGDGKYLSIAAASILAKTHRDAYMEKIAAEFPVYGWPGNKGYPTRAHREAIRQFGPCIHHRQSFRLLPGAEQGSLF
jgi:ribonuclease HII